MKKILLIGAAIVGLSAVGLSAPASAEELGVRVGPVGAGVTVGESHFDRDRDRDHRAVIIREHEPRSRTVIIRRHRGDDFDRVEHRTVIHHDYY